MIENYEIFFVVHLKFGMIVLYYYYQVNNITKNEMEYIQYEFIYIEYIMNLNTRFWIKRMAIYVIFLITF